MAKPPPAVHCTATNDKTTRSALFADTGRLSLVELPGIEPGSYGANPVLLRVQFVERFS